jgi:Cysteine-rich CWC/DinB superfamily
MLLKQPNSCPRCHTLFVCGVSQIEICQCSTITLSEATKEYIAKHYTGCLCKKCLTNLNEIFVMKHQIEQASKNLLTIIEKASPLLYSISPTQAQAKPLPQQWSKQEIIGHLIDSACNNQQKFVRTMAQSHVDFVGYEQNFWVDSQSYNHADWHKLLQFWEGYNRHIAHIMAHVPAEKLQNTIQIGSHGTYTLSFIMPDYVEHLKHHLKQILPQADFLDNHFSTATYFK